VNTIPHLSHRETDGSALRLDEWKGDKIIHVNI